MKLKILLVLIFLSGNILKGYSQTVLWSEDFEGTVKMALNTTDLSSVGVDTLNRWVVNSSYTGSNQHINSGPPGCTAVTGIQLLVAATPVQPAGASKYLHMYSPWIAANTTPSCTNANWIYAGDPFLASGCPPPTKIFTKMNSGVSTVGKTNVTLKFLWACGSTNVYAQLYYSTNGGTNWTEVESGYKYKDNGSWTNKSISLPAFDNVSDLRFAFQWINPAPPAIFGWPTADSDPPLCVDDMSIEGTGGTVNSITTGTISSSSLCACANVSVPFTSTGTFTGGNTYTAQLSNSTGSFASAVSIGTLSSTSNSGTISATIPCNTTTGSQYRIRVTSNTPAVTGSDNNVNLTINPAGTAGTVTALKDTVCENTPAQLTVTGTTGSIQWESSSTTSNFTPVSGATEATFTTLPSGTTYYRVKAGSGNCNDFTAPYKITVQAAPVGNFTFTVTNKHVVFNSSGTIGATKYNWEFGDGTPDNTQTNPSHDYASYGTYHVCLKVENGSNCSFTICLDVHVDPVGIEPVSAENHWYIYPNPFQNKILIKGINGNKMQIEQIGVYDLLGRMVSNKFSKDNQNNIEVDASGLTNGMYLLKIRTAEGNYIQPLIKN